MSLFLGILGWVLVLVWAIANGVRVARRWKRERVALAVLRPCSCGRYALTNQTWDGNLGVYYVLAGHEHGPSELQRHRPEGLGRCA